MSFEQPLILSLNNHYQRLYEFSVKQPRTLAVCIPASRWPLAERAALSEFVRRTQHGTALQVFSQPSQVPYAHERN